MITHRNRLVGSQAVLIFHSDAHSNRKRLLVEEEEHSTAGGRLGYAGKRAGETVGPDTA